MEIGRNFEALGEDPYLTTVLSSAYIQGAQDRGVFATAKHLGSLMMELYNADGTPGPSNRNSFNINIPEKAWRELYLPPYKVAAEVRADITLSYELGKKRLCLLVTYRSQRESYNAIILYPSSLMIY